VDDRPAGDPAGPCVCALSNIPGSLEVACTRIQHTNNTAGGGLTQLTALPRSTSRPDTHHCFRMVVNVWQHLAVLLRPASHPTWTCIAMHRTDYMRGSARHCQREAVGSRQVAQIWRGKRKAVLYHMSKQMWIDVQRMLRSAMAACRLAQYHTSPSKTVSHKSNLLERHFRHDSHLPPSTSLASLR